ncbi:MAG: mechanosensitive ion channel family protein [Brevinema sp.]
MFTSIMKLLQPAATTNTNTVTNTLDTAGEIITPVVAGDEFIALLNKSMASSNNQIFRVIYHIIHDNPYAIFLFIVFSVLLFTILLRSFVYLFTAKSKKRYIMKKIWRMFMSPLSLWIGLIVGMILGLDAFALPKIIKYGFQTSLLSILLWIIFTRAQRLFDLYIRGILIYRVYENKLRFFRNKNVLTVLHRTVGVVWFLTFITVLLGLWGVQLGPILAGLGIAGIVVGLALQDTLSHIVGGVSLMLDDTYSEGDYVKLENAVEGIIVQIGYRSTKLKTFDEEIINIPNGVLSRMTITNLSQPYKRVRVTKFYQTVATDATPELVKDLLVQAVKSVPTILNYPEPYVFFMEPKGSMYVFRVNFFVSSYTVRLSQSDLVQQEIVRLFALNNIRFGVDESYVHTDIADALPFHTIPSKNSKNEDPS